MNVLEIQHVSKVHHNHQRDLTVLEDINFQVKEGEIISIVGPSGSGKTTLLGLCAGLDLPSEGSIRIHDHAIEHLDEDERASLRNQHIGFIFQNFQLMPTLSALENVMVPLELRGDPSARKEATKLLERVGLGDRLEHYPSQLSGGEQQRVALARAFANKPSILFADEPTGNLDDATSDHIEDLLFEINKESGTTLVIVTHDMSLAHKTDRILKLRNGKVVD